MIPGFFFQVGRFFSGRAFWRSTFTRRPTPNQNCARIVLEIRAQFEHNSSTIVLELCSNFEHISSTWSWTLGLWRKIEHLRYQRPGTLGRWGWTLGRWAQIPGRWDVEGPNSRDVGSQRPRDVGTLGLDVGTLGPNVPGRWDVGARISGLRRRT